MTSLVNSIDIGILLVFLAANLIVGLLYRWRQKIKHIRNYAIGRKDFSTATLTATIVVSWIGASFLFFVLEHTYKQGLYFIIVIPGAAICILFVGQLVLRMGEFLNNVSVAEAMGDLYGKTVRIITGISGVLSVLGVVAIEFQVMGEIITLILGVEGPWITVMAAVIVILYSIAGGIESVTFTDVLQFFTFGTIVPIIALVVWNNLKNPDQVVQMLSTHPHFDLHAIVGWNHKFLSTLAMLLWFAVPAMDPAIFQRISMSRNVLQAKQSFSYAGILILLINLFVIWLGILLLSSDQTLEPSKLFSHIIQNYASPGLRGCIGVGIMALAMSTADSYLNASAVLLANDILKPLRVTITSEILTVRLFCLFSGTLALFLALYTSGILELLTMANSFYMPVVTVPLLLAILGFRSSTRAVLIGIAAGFTTVSLWSIFLDNGDSIVPGMLANLLGLLGTHYWLKEPGGWQQVAPESPLALERAARRKAWQRRLKAVKAFRLYPYLQQNLPKQEVFYFFFGLYTIAATYTAFYTIGDVNRASYQVMYDGIYHTVLFATTAFLTFPIWPPVVKSQRFIAFFWPVGISAILFFAGTLLAIMSHFHHMQVMILMINVIMAVLLLRWPLALILAFTGIGLAVFFFKQYTGTALPMGIVDSLQFRIVYGMLLLTSLLIALFKGKQAYRKLETSTERLRSDKDATSKELLSSIGEQVRFIQALRASGAPVLSVLASLSREIKEETKGLGLPASITEKIKSLNEQLAPMAVQLDRLDQQAITYLRLEVETIALNELLATLQDDLEAQGIRHIFKKLTQQDTLQGDVTKIKKLLGNSISFVQRTTEADAPIVISIEDTQLGYPLHSVRQGYTKKIAALRFSITTGQRPPELAQCYTTQINDASSIVPKAAQNLPLVSNQRIVAAHYGHAATLMQAGSIVLLYVLPVKLREVRHKDLDEPCMELGSVLTRADDTYPGAQAQEQAFLKAVKEQTTVDLSLIEKAINVIKDYHGPVKRKSGEPFYLHPLAVAQIVLGYNQEEATLLGALLHDTVEDTPMHLKNIETMFGKEVACIVDSVTHLESNKASFYKVQLSPHENIRKLLEVKDKRALYVKLADRLHNMRTIQAKAYASQRRTAEETLLFFVPLSRELGLIDVAEELKTLCFEVFSKVR